MGVFGFFFFFSYWIFIFLLSALKNLLSTGFVTKHGLILQVADHNCILENYVSVVSMIGYFPYISILESPLQRCICENSTLKWP